MRRGQFSPNGSHRVARYVVAETKPWEVAERAPAASAYARKESIVDVAGCTSELVARYNDAMEDFNPYAAPQHDLRLNIVADEFYDSVWRDRELLVMRKDAVLPARCVRCNAPAEERLKIRWLGWSRPTSAKIELGICDRHLRRMRAAVTTTWYAAPNPSQSGEFCNYGEVFCRAKT